MGEIDLGLRDYLAAEVQARPPSPPARKSTPMYSPATFIGMATRYLERALMGDRNRYWVGAFDDAMIKRGLRPVSQVSRR